MMYYEKAIENFAKKTNEYYKELIKTEKNEDEYVYYKYRARNRIITFNSIIEGMMAHGKCPNKEMPALLYCPDCPVYLVKERKPELEIDCDNLSVTDMREILAREYK